MKALRVERLTADLSGVALRSVDRPERASGEVLVRVRAASLNYPDLLMTRGEYQFKPDPPFTSGMEFAGEVLEAEPDTGFEPGDRVRGGAKTGGFAQMASVPAAGLRIVPDGIDDLTAAAMGAAYQTAYVALVELGRLQAGQTVLVHGAGGGVGLAACDLARALGAHVIAATRNETKREAIEDAARPDAIIANTGRFREQVADLTDGRLCDLVFDPVGGDVFDESTRCVAFGGSLLVVGFVSGRIPSVAANIPLIKGFGVVGVRAGEYARRFPDRAERIAAEIDRLVLTGAVRPHVAARVPLDEWRSAFERMAAGNVVGKIVIEP